VFDLDAYLERIGLEGRPSIAQVHRAHLTSIPFENLDPHQGLPVSLEVEDLERKLVSERRGGYCFEQNLLLKAALEADRRVVCHDDRAALHAEGSQAASPIGL
jgi:N-hydroxyarylamine O-acetyltransferase